MRATIIVTIPSWLRLPVQGEYEGEDHVCMVQHDHYDRSGYDDVDRTCVEYQRLLDTLDVVGCFQVSHCNKYVCLDRPRDVCLASPIVSHARP